MTKIGDRVRWTEWCNKYPFFEIAPGDGIVVKFDEGTLWTWVLPLDDNERAAVYENWGEPEEVEGIEAYCVQFGDPKHTDDPPLEVVQ